MSSPRYTLAKLSTFGITHIHHQNPFIVAWWSAVFPGFGHYLLSQYFRATLLTLTEVIINTLAHINEAMVLSYCGEFDRAKSVLQPTWMFGYILVYILTIWDSYRSAHTQNKLYSLAINGRISLPHATLFQTEFQYLEQRSPLTAAIFSLCFPGMGPLYNHRFLLAFYGILWWWIYLTLSKAHWAFLHLLHGQHQMALSLLNPHWLLFMPSVWGGSVYHAYITAIEHNRLYKLEQRQYLMDRYGNANLHIFQEEG